MNNIHEIIQIVVKLGGIAKSLECMLPGCKIKEFEPVGFNP